MIEVRRPVMLLLCVRCQLYGVIRVALVSRALKGDGLRSGSRFRMAHSGNVTSAFHVTSSATKNKVFIDGVGARRTT